MQGSEEGSVRRLRVSREMAEFIHELGLETKVVEIINRSGLEPEAYYTSVEIVPSDEPMGLFEGFYMLAAFVEGLKKIRPTAESEQLRQEAKEMVARVRAETDRRRRQA
jgi:hypothetical protein